MTTLKDFLQSFEKLSHENKKKKILNVLEYIKENMEFAPSLIEFINRQEDCSDDFMITIYKMIMQAALVESEKSNESSLKKKVDYLTLLHEQESKEHIQEDRDSEQLLASL